MNRPTPADRLRLIGLVLIGAVACAFAGPTASPRGVVLGFCAADAAGKALDSETAAEVLALTTAEEAPGWDAISVISGYEVGTAEVDDDRAQVTVTYHMLGQLEGMTFEAANEDVEVTYTLVKKDGQWKIDEPQLAPHVDAPSVLAFLKTIEAAKDPDGRAAIKAIAAEL